MANDKKYISKIVKGADTLYIKDLEALADIANLKNSVTGGMHYLGVSSSPISDKMTTGPWIIENVIYIASGTPVSGLALLNAGDIAIYGDLEFIWSSTSSRWQEFGSTGSLKALAFKDSASATYTPAGSNASSNVTLSGGSTSKLVTTTITGVSGSTTASSVSKTTKKLGKTSVGSASDWNAGTMFSATYTENTETLTLNEGTAPSLTVTPTNVASGSLVATTTSGAGDTLVESLTIDSVTVPTAASSATTVATGSVNANGEGATVATALPTGGTAAAQTFTGTLDTITVN